MKNRWLFGAFTAIAVIVSTILSPASYASGTNTWHSMAQWQRNQAIVNRAYQYLNINVGIQCKEWVRKVVKEASVNHVTIPATSPAPNDWYWQSDYPYNNVVGMSTLAEYMQVGWIIQMRLSTGIAHTAIVVGNNGYGITLIDSNWFSTSAPNTVKTHFLTYTEFYSKLAFSSSFSVYYIL